MLSMLMFALDDFEVSIFLTEVSTNHSLLTKQKTFADKPPLKSNSNKITPFFNTNDNPINVEDEQVPGILQEEDAEETSLRNIPEATTLSATKRRRDADDDDPIFVNSDDEDEYQRQNTPAKKRKKTARVVDEEEEPADDKKKLALSTAYEGFSIYGRVLCLIVKRKGVKKAAAAGGPSTGSEMLENWISTQAAQDGLGGFNDDG